MHPNHRPSLASVILIVVAAFLATLARPGEASEADALAIDANIQARHMPFGTLLDPIFTAPDSNQIATYTRCGDSATWTGHYLAAEAFRYKATGSPAALANVKTAIAGIKSLADVTGNNLLARCIIPMSSAYAPDLTQEEKNNGIYQNNSAGYFWVGNTSRDQYSGVLFGLSVAFSLVDDAGVRSSVSALATRLIDFLTGHNWSIVLPDGTSPTTFLIRPDQQLSFLEVGHLVNSSHYDLTLPKTLLSATVPVPIAFDALSNSSYFKFNLDDINLYNLVRLDDSVFDGDYTKAYSILWNHVKDQQNAFFNMIDFALNGPNATRDAATVTMLQQWLLRPRRDFFVDLRGQLPSCNSPDEACNPIPIPLRVPATFLWEQSPFQLDGGGTGLIENSGVDYILPYWMARYYGIQAADSVVSAAAGGIAVAAESIASYYGSNLANATAQAASIPLPTTLAGISVQVQDSAGVTRPAPLFYVSPGQINFEIPAGSALGQAIVTVTDSSNAKRGSTTANVQNVAPALFTADGSGKGVAAAVAITVGVNKIQTATPIFQCSNGTCTSVPINLGVDTPTYLSLFGTGIRNRSSLANVSVTINGVSLPVQYAWPQGFYAGLDQVNIPVFLSLRGSGETDLVLTVDGQAANTVRVNVQ